MHRRSPLVLAILLLAGAGFPLLANQEAAARIRLPEGEWIEATEPIEILWTRPLTAGEGRIAVFIDETDVTDLFVPTLNALRYDAAAMPLPAGRHELVVWLVSPEGDWVELQRAPIAVRTRRGFETAEVRPSVDLSSNGQVHEEARPVANLNPRGNHLDGTVQLGLRSDHQRGPWGFQSDIRTTGVSYAPEALRFQAEGDDAPRFDLASHSLQIGRRNGRLSLGNVTFGTNRHLISGFGSRGVVLDIPLTRIATLRLGAMNGTSIVGWNNIAGLNESDHMILGAAIALELIPSRPGALMAELSWLDGSLLPTDHFNQGSIRSAEKSQGLGLRLAATDPSQRFTAEGGYSVSRFREGFDAGVEDGLEVLPVDQQRRGAAWFDASVALIRARPISERHQLNLTAGYRFERIEPLYRSLGASVQADVLRSSIDLTGNAGPFLAQLAFTTLEDNLDDLRAILKTKTRQAQLTLGLQLGAFLGESPRASLLPILSVSFDRFHQYGVALPDNPEFAAGHVPDQVSGNRSASIEWTVGRVNFGYRWNGSSQDNRQPGRELADSSAATHGLYGGIALGDRLSINLDLGQDSFENQELRREDTTERAGLTFSWRLFGQTALSTTLSRTYASDNLDEQRNRAFDASAEISSGFPLGRGAAASQRTGRVFVRLADRESKSRNRVFGVEDDQRGLTVTTGVNLSIQ